jgi:Caspase domain
MRPCQFTILASISGYRRGRDVALDGSMSLIVRRAVSIVFLMIFATLANAAGRTALVVGNSAYPFGALNNPANDAKLIAETLKKTGFEVTIVLDANRVTLQSALLEFSRDIRTKETVGLFYYAGHGAQVNGANYLIPIDADIKSESEVKIFGINVDEFVATLERADGRTNIVILDACRNNPFGASTRSVNRGMALPDAPAGTFVALSTSPGAVALDGEGSNSPYAEALSQSMLEPNVSIEQAFKVTRRLVLQNTKQKQVPWETSSLTGDFYFLPKTETPAPIVETPAVVVEATPEPIIAAEAKIEDPPQVAIAEPVPAQDTDGYIKLDIQPQVFPLGKWAEGLVIANNAIWVAESGSRRIVKIDPGSGDLLDAVIVGRLPVSMAADPDGNVYAAAFTDGKIFKQPPDGKGKVLASFKRPQFIRGIGYGNNALYVATSTEENERTTTVSRINPKSGKLTASSPLLFDANKMVMLGDKPWILDTQNQVRMLDGTTLEQLDSVQDEGFLLSIGANRDAAYIGGSTQQQAGNPVIYRHSKDNPNERISQVLEGEELIVAIVANNDRVAALGNQGAVWILDAKTLKVLKWFDSNREPHAGVFENGHLFITTFTSTSTADTSELLIYSDVGKID